MFIIQKYIINKIKLETFEFSTLKLGNKISNIIYGSTTPCNSGLEHALFCYFTNVVLQVFKFILIPQYSNNNYQYWQLFIELSLILSRILCTEEYYLL